MEVFLLLDTVVHVLASPVDGRVAVQIPIGQLITVWGWVAEEAARTDRVCMCAFLIATKVDGDVRPPLFHTK